MTAEPDFDPGLRSELEHLGRRLAREALDEAAGRARALLVDRLTEALVSEGQRSLRGEHPPVAQPPGAAAETEGCYVFAIVHAEGPALELSRGLEGAGRVEELVEGPLSALVCPVEVGLFEGLSDEEIGPESRLARLARDHDQLVCEVFSRRSVLPLRFGTVLSSKQDVTGVLARGRDRFLSELERVRARAEWICVVGADPVSLPASRPGAGPEAPPHGADYLAAREARLEEREAGVERVDGLARRLQAALERHAEAALSLPAGEFGSRIAYLVAEERQPAFHDAVQDVAASASEGLVELRGPLPPYHFVRLELEADRKWADLAR